MIELIKNNNVKDMYIVEFYENQLFQFMESNCLYEKKT